MLSVALDRAAAVDWYRRNRARSAALFDIIEPSAYYSRPIALRNPIVFYEGHLPAFSVLAFLRRGLGRPSVDPRLEKLFERGIDPESGEAEREVVDQDPGHRQKENQNQKKDDDLAA